MGLKPCPLKLPSGRHVPRLVLSTSRKTQVLEKDLDTGFIGLISIYTVYGGACGLPDGLRVVRFRERLRRRACMIVEKAC